MNSKIENIRSELDEISADTRQILDRDITETELERIRAYMQQLLTQSEMYYQSLEDKSENSRSEISRRIAKTLLGEERWSVNPLYNKKGFPAEISSDEISSLDLDIEALYVEYLTGRAGQAVRDAEIGALYLKLLSYQKGSRSEMISITNNTNNKH